MAIRHSYTTPELNKFRNIHQLARHIAREMALRLRNLGVSRSFWHQEGAMVSTDNEAYAETQWRAC